MLKKILSLSALSVALIASNAAYAQSDKPGEDRALPTKPATAEQKAAAKKQRQATSKEMVKKDEGRVTEDTSKGSYKSATAQQKAAAKAKRQQAGAAATKESTPAGDLSGTPK